jgi:hypothetical protein
MKINNVFLSMIKFIEFFVRFFRWKGYWFLEIKWMQSVFAETRIEACRK